MRCLWNACGRRCFACASFAYRCFVIRFRVVAVSSDSASWQQRQLKCGTHYRDAWPRTALLKPGSLTHHRLIIWYEAVFRDAVWIVRARASAVTAEDLLFSSAFLEACQWYSRSPYIASVLPCGQATAVPKLWSNSVVRLRRNLGFILHVCVVSNRR